MGPAGCLRLQEDKYRGIPDTDRSAGTWGAPLPSLPSPAPTNRAAGRPAPPGLANPPWDVSQQAWSRAGGWPKGTPGPAGRAHGDTSTIWGVSKHFYKRPAHRLLPGAGDQKNPGVSQVEPLLPSVLPKEVKAINLGVWEVGRRAGSQAKPQ